MTIGRHGMVTLLEMQIATKVGFKIPNRFTTICITGNRPGPWMDRGDNGFSGDMTHGMYGRLRDWCHGKGATVRLLEDTVVPAPAA